MAYAQSMTINVSRLRTSRYSENCGRSYAKAFPPASRRVFFSAQRRAASRRCHCEALNCKRVPAPMTSSGLIRLNRRSDRENIFCKRVGVTTVSTTLITLHLPNHPARQGQREQPRPVLECEWHGYSIRPHWTAFWAMERTQSCWARREGRTALAVRMPVRDSEARQRKGSSQWTLAKLRVSSS